jgi:prepilin-type N-terminal cleavage/methylation domain-containing protein
MDAMRQRQSGLTMIEVMIASVILVAVSAMSMYLLLNSSNHVTEMEVGVRLEQQAREVMSAMCAELRQAKMTSVEVVNTSAAIPPTSPYTYSGANLTEMPTIPGSGPSSKPPSFVPSLPWYTQPYTTWDIAASPALQAAATFNGIRFHIPGYSMDLVGTDPISTKVQSNVPTSNANADINGTTYTVGSQTFKVDNFNLAAFKNSPSSTDWVTEIQYWWESDTPTSLGVIKKVETIRYSDGTYKARHYTILARNVASLTFTVPKYPAWVLNAGMAVPQTNPPPLPPIVVNQYTPGSEKQVTIQIQMQAPDPKYPTNAAKNIFRTLSTAVDVRN